MIALHLVAVESGELDDRPVERGAPSHVAGDRRRVAGPGWARASAQAHSEPWWARLAGSIDGRVALALHVPELADVVVAPGLRTLRPAEEEVTRRLGAGAAR